MSYALSAKQCLDMIPDGDDGALIQSKLTMPGASSHAYTVEFEVRPLVASAGTGIIYEWMHYDATANPLSGIRIQRNKNDLDVTIAGSLGVWGWALVGPVFVYNRERVFVRVGIQYRVGPPPENRLVIWRNGNLVAGTPTAWQGTLMDYPSLADVETNEWMRRKYVDTGLGPLPYNPFIGRFYQGCVFRGYAHHPTIPMEMTGWEFTYGLAWEIWGLKEGSGSDLFGTKGRRDMEITQGLNGRAFWRAETWYHDTDYAGMGASKRHRYPGLLGNHLGVRV